MLDIDIRSNIFFAFKTSSRHVFKTCWRCLQRNNFSSSNMSWRCFEAQKMFAGIKCNLTIKVLNFHLPSDLHYVKFSLYNSYKHKIITGISRWVTFNSIFKWLEKLKDIKRNIQKISTTVMINLWFERKQAIFTLSGSGFFCSKNSLHSIKWEFLCARIFNMYIIKIIS